MEGLGTNGGGKFNLPQQFARRVLSVFLALAMVLTMLPVTAVEVKAEDLTVEIPAVVGERVTLDAGTDATWVSSGGL